MRALERVLDLLFPPRCPFCGRVLDRPGVCAGCASSLPWTAEADSLWELPGALRCAAPLWYEGAARQGLLRFKFQGAAGAADPLGGLIAQCAAERLSGEFAGPAAGGTPTRSGCWRRSGTTPPNPV